MAIRIVYEVRRHIDGWIVAREGDLTAKFGERGRAIRFAHLMAHREFEAHGRPCLIRLCDHGAPIDLMLLGESPYDLPAGVAV